MIDSAVVAATQDTAVAWLAEERRVVQALLVEVEGSAPLPIGAMMVIDDQGNIEGSITGGCVEGAVVTEAEELLAAGSPAPAKLLRYGISDELAGTVGLMCGGIVHILIYELAGEAADVERAVLEAHADGRPAAVATLVDGESAGRRLAVIDNAVVGSLGDTDLLDRNVAREAQGLLEEGKSTLRRFGADGATLGDDLRVHIRSYALPPQMWIIGAIDFSAALAPFASQIGYEVTGSATFKNGCAWFLTSNFISVSDFPSEVTRVVMVALSATAARTVLSGKRNHSSARVGGSLGCR